MNFMVLNSSGLSTAKGGEAAVFLVPGLGGGSGLPTAGEEQRSSYRWGGSIAVFPPLWAVGI